MAVFLLFLGVVRNKTSIVLVSFLSFCYPTITTFFSFFSFLPEGVNIYIKSADIYSYLQKGRIILSALGFKLNVGMRCNTQKYYGCPLGRAQKSITRIIYHNILMLSILNYNILLFLAFFISQKAI